MLRRREVDIRINKNTHDGGSDKEGTRDVIGGALMVLGGRGPRITRVCMGSLVDEEVSKSS